MQVTGGAGGTSADLAAMAGAAAVLSACADELAELRARLGSLALDADLLDTAALDPLGWARLQGRLVALQSGPGGFLLLPARTGGLATAVYTAARAYAEGDRLVAAAFAAGRNHAAGSVGQLLWRGAWRVPHVLAPVLALAAGGLLLWRTGDLVVVATADLARDAADGTLRLDSLDERAGVLGWQLSVRVRDDVATASDAGLGWLARHPVATEQAVAAAPSFLSGVSGLRTARTHYDAHGGRVVRAGTVPWDFPPRDVEDLAGLAAVLGYTSGLLGRGPVRVRPAVSAPPPPSRPPAGVGDLVRRAVALAPSRDGTVTGEPGRVRVERVTSPAGRAAVVYVPATQTWDRGHGPNPMDATSNLDAMAGIPSSAQAGVVQALEAAGVGRHEPLLLVGYSQGGLTSMALAGDAAFAERFSPTAVLTVGAPVGGFEAPAGVEVLSLEHAEDLVTVLDGAPNPDRPGWTTVRREVLDPRDGDLVVQAVAPDRPLAAHDAEAYVRTAERVDAVDHPSVRAWRDAAHPFLDGPGVTSTADDWVAERVPESGVSARGPGGTP